MEGIYAILEELRPEFNFRESEDFIEDGYLDSFDIITLIDTIEEKYNVKVDGLDIIPENFNSVQAIVDLIKQRGGNI